MKQEEGGCGRRCPWSCQWPSWPRKPVSPSPRSERPDFWNLTHTHKFPVVCSFADLVDSSPSRLMLLLQLLRYPCLLRGWLAPPPCLLALPPVSYSAITHLSHRGVRSLQLPPLGFAPSDFGFVGVKGGFSYLVCGVVWVCFSSCLSSLV